MGVDSKYSLYRGTDGWSMLSRNSGKLNTWILPSLYSYSFFRISSGSMAEAATVALWDGFVSNWRVPCTMISLKLLSHSLSGPKTLFAFLRSACAWDKVQSDRESK